MRFDSASRGNRTGTDLADSLRARLVRNLGLPQVQKAQWHKVDDAQTTAKAKKDWGL